MSKENLVKESSTHTSIKLCVKNGSLKALNSRNTSCVNTNLTTISCVTLFRNLIMPRHSLRVVGHSNPRGCNFNHLINASAPREM